MTLRAEHEILEEAEKGHYAVGAFFPLSMDWIAPMFEAAEEERSPIIVSNSPELAAESGMGTYSAALLAAARAARVPVSLHMDHGFTTDEKTPGHIAQFIEHGWNTVMYDGSMKPLDDNINETREIVESSHAAGVDVLGAVGLVPRDVRTIEGYQVPQELLTKPDEAARFVKETGVDALAISIGQFVHPLIFGESRPIRKSAHLHLDLLEKLRETTGVHLVLHGGTHIADGLIRGAIECGISEIKVAASLAIVWADALRKYMNDHPDDTMVPYMLRPALAQVKAETVNCMRLFGSSGKA